MIAYSWGSKCLAGAASQLSRRPAIVGTFRVHPDNTQWAEQQTVNLRAAGSIPAIHTLFDQQPNPSDPGLASVTLAR